MINRFPGIKRPISGPLLLLSLGYAQSSLACGGFFCDLVPIDQAGEQIVFRQEAGQTTAMIKIDYVGAAEDFGWVLPVPQSPEISLGSDQIFTELEQSTRPQFLLSREGERCPQSFFPTDGASSSTLASSAVSASSSPSQIIIEQSLSIGAFDAQVVSSDDPEALAKWLADNNLDLTDQGSALLAPYTQAKSKFVVLKLKNNASVGSIQPIILKYASSAPVIPMTLTAVAAQEDMGVLVWLLGDGRGVPKNFKHVIPNYSRLNWFRGTRSAYASYQNLITSAMNEAGGQGFATDFAGYLPNLPERFTTAQQWEVLLSPEEPISDAGFINNLWSANSSLLQNAIREILPTSDTFAYSRPLILEELFTTEELSAARAGLTLTVQEQLIAPLNNAIDLLDDNLYLTRLYTTLSGDEMTMNPEFTFNTGMEEQPLSRQATLTQACIDNQDNFTLTLGAGTGRAGEVVAEGWGFRPFNPVINSAQQQAAWRVQKTSANLDPTLLAENTFERVTIGEQQAVSSSNASTSSTPATGNNQSSSTASSAQTINLGSLNFGLLGALAALWLGGLGLRSRRRKNINS